MNHRTDSTVDRIADRARDRYQSLINDARSQTVQAAGRVRETKRPVQKLSSLGIELSNISHRATRNVLRSQTRLVEHQLDALAGRLHAAARATSIRDLVRGQIRLIPENASRLIEDTRQTLSAVASAGGEVRNVVSDAVVQIRRSDEPKAAAATAATAAPAAQTAARPAAKVVRKKAPRRKTAKKTAKAAAQARKPRKKTARKVAKKTTAARTDTAKS